MSLTHYRYLRYLCGRNGSTSPFEPPPTALAPAEDVLAVAISQGATPPRHPRRWGGIRHHAGAGGRVARGRAMLTLAEGQRYPVGGLDGLSRGRARRSLPWAGATAAVGGKWALPWAGATAAVGGKWALPWAGVTAAVGGKCASRVGAIAGRLGRRGWCCVGQHCAAAGGKTRSRSWVALKVSVGGMPYGLDVY